MTRTWCYAGYLDTIDDLDLEDDEPEQPPDNLDELTDDEINDLIAQAIYSKEN